MTRDKLSMNIPVYLTEGQYDDHGEDVMEYVRNGGGLIGNIEFMDYKVVW